MALEMPERYRRWFQYEKDSHSKVLESLSSVPEERRRKKEFQKAVSLMAQIMAARLVWLFRLGVAKQGPTDFFPRGLALAELSAGVREMENAWSAYQGSRPRRSPGCSTIEAPKGSDTATASRTS